MLSLKMILRLVTNVAVLSFSSRVSFLRSPRAVLLEAEKHTKDGKRAERVERASLARGHVKS